ncbi:MAG: SDR family oxidoreductase [Candidatus Marinimicrobia bacterium]|jgi:NAD(P)-dependent dehydrogenase (short-subunit alcohol dehydrogenase family)|nr:SDR family oxidoreductase [Candidatus Neomarinimicrobiota bacterium]MCK9484775.1 SDR family oxidoreductase [Candidatus Neomarinimicrobiota bacterium]MCK9559351.1 SDR family oxidoreductase [Candidatus Neomarinimicrobiota bacterium]MDD5231476.1 SDR family oxidoreductase [Candidatus Neomarinimicrobiota bacterium]MDD5539352.1 SDR family oxidoreductase [Candidatus Neomarinimicrobiota bacterium]
MEIRLDNKTVVITGGSGVLGRAMVWALFEAGANVAVLDLRQPAEGGALPTSPGKSGNRLRFIQADVLNRESLQSAAEKVLTEFERVDILINGAGGNRPDATTSAERSFFDLPAEALRFTMDLNLLGTILPSQVFGRIMAEQKTGNVVNITSMNAFRPLTRIPAYSAAKAAVSNFTQWLAVHMAQEYSSNIRVNAIAPGFFLTDQNRFLLTDKATGELTERGRKIIAATPLGRFGEPDELIGTLFYLISDSSRFVTGVIIPVDGGFNAYSGV